MNNIFAFLIFFLLIACSNKNMVYWCGDHPCVSDKEKKAYFEKTMIVEVKNINKLDKNKSEIEKITQQALIEEKKRIKDEKYLTKQAREEEKKRIKDEKYLAAQIQKEEKKRIKDEKYLTKQARKEEKKRIKDEKYLAAQIQKDEKKIIKNKNKSNKIKKAKKIAKIDTDLLKNDMPIPNFENLVDRITKENMSKRYPDINRIPN